MFGGAQLLNSLLQYLEVIEVATIDYGFEKPTKCKHLHEKNPFHGKFSCHVLESFLSLVVSADSEYWYSCLTSVAS